MLTMVISAIISLILMTVISAVIIVVISLITMLLAIMRCVILVVPIILHKIDSLAASVVLMTVFAPIFCMAWRYAHINWFSLHIYALDYSRLTIDYTWLWIRIITNVYSTIKARLAYAD